MVLDFVVYRKPAKDLHDFISMFHVLCRVVEVQRKRSSVCVEFAALIDVVWTTEHEILEIRVQIVEHKAFISFRQVADITR